jgi:two-component system sensor histidine kinase YesM
LAIFKAYAHQKIFFKLLVTFLLIGIIPLILAVSVYYVASNKLLIQDTGAKTFESIKFVSTLLDRMIRENGIIFETIESEKSFAKIFNSENSNTLNNSDKALLYNTIYLLLDEKFPKPGIYVMDSSGVNIFSNKKIPKEYDPVKYKHWGIFRKASAARGEIVVYPYKMYERKRSARVLSLGKAVYSGDNVIGYIIVDLYQEHFYDLMTSINNPERFRIIGRNLLPLFSLTDGIKESSVNKLIKKTALSENPYIQFKTGKQRLLFSDYQSEETGLRVAAIQPLNQLINVSRVVFLPFTVLVVVTSIISIVLAFFVARGFSQPIYDVISCVGKVEQGDFSARTEIKRKDECAILGKSVNAMIARIQELITNIKQKERSLRVAEMESLQAQIHPHMIFNTLEMIKWSIRMDKNDEAVHILTQFSKILRQGIDNKDEMVTVSEEMRIVGIYLDIQQRRFDDRLKVDLQVDSDIETARIPKYIIQPIIENSIVHGLRDKLGVVTISVCGYGDKSDLWFEISDNGKGISAETIRKIMAGEENYGSKSNSTGIKNVLKRIKLYYGPEYGLSIESSSDRGTKVILKMQNSVII